MDITEKLEQALAQDEQGLTVTIYQKNGDPYLAADGTEATVTVVGKESRKYRAMRDSITKRMMYQRKAKLTPEDLARNRMDQAAAAVVAWHGWEMGAATAACTTDNVRLLLRAEHILEQVESAIDAHGHTDFFSSNSTN